MALTLGQLLEYGYRDIHADVVDGVATGGSATTIVDSTLTSKPYTVSTGLPRPTSRVVGLSPFPLALPLLCTFGTNR